ncbi:hypothetical protein N7466_011494 [Penicillium verhagenii]|uniref:uncharacterized protein n=1 Tax=Penicillium verhagenii TaxID=1562060 RepID=UPI002544FB1F|nr:uncharacterized protein N7466_011494 [Penicillium verhagenii]KAJ5915561.1 hypothetical protein N7466_011494 [Penicillium verhagenii]
MASDEKSRNPFEDLGGHEGEQSTSQAVDPSVPDEELPQYSPPEVRAESSSAATNKSQPLPPSFGRVIAIPAIAPANESPFLRAYAPTLTKHQLPKESFMRFLDQLNDVMTSSPPMQVLDATGGMLRSVPILFPLHWLGSAVSGLANLGSQGITKSRADSTIRQANKELFEPRGLKAEIAKLDAVAHIANIPILNSQGKVDQDAPLIRQMSALPMAEFDLSQEVDMQQHRIQILQPWIAELEVDAALPWSQKSKLTRFNAALKKRNDGMRSRGQQPSKDEEEPEFRKGLWLVIREVGDEKAAGPSSRK